MLGLGCLRLPAADLMAGPALLDCVIGCNVTFWALGVQKEAVVANTSLGRACDSGVSGSRRWGWVHGTSFVTCLLARARHLP